MRVAEREKRIIRRIMPTAARVSRAFSIFVGYLVSPNAFLKAESVAGVADC